MPAPQGASTELPVYRSWLLPPTLDEPELRLPSNDQHSCRVMMFLRSALSSILLCSCSILADLAGHPLPEPWPETFHAVTVQNRSGSLAIVDLYYEYAKGRNANLIYSQLSGSTLFDVE